MNNLEEDIDDDCPIEPEQTLSDKFDKAFHSYKKIVGENNFDEFESEEQLRVAINTLKYITKTVSAMRLFSDNENWQELPTTTLKFFLLPALLGFLTLECKKEERSKVLEIAEVYFKDFITRCHNYGLTKYKITESDIDLKEGSEISIASKSRQAVISRYKETKELEQHLDKYDLTDIYNTDENELRTYYNVLIQHFSCKVMSELECISREKPILEHMEKLKIKKPVVTKPSDNPAPQPLKKLIIARNEYQKNVFGIGYPSVPIMTIEDFYDERQKQGLFPAPGTKSLQDKSLENPEFQKLSEDLAECEKERLIEVDDSSTLLGARNWDDWKDDHRRGWGNRHNMG